MAKLSAETRAQIKQAVRHPAVWWKGADLPEEQIRPWEGGIQFIAEMLKGFMNGFTGIKDRLFIGMGEGKVPPNWKSVHDVIRITWDAINDPPIGVYMDRKRFPKQIHRWIMRINATLSPIFITIQCFNLGLSPLQRLIQWTLIAIAADIISTANAVSEAKIWAGITPYSEQRGTLQLYRSLGDTVSDLLSGITPVLMGLRDVLGISDYQIMIWGALISMPITIFSRWTPSFAKQRVDFTVKISAEGEAAPDSPSEEKLSFREAFALVKHNRWFLMFTVVRFIQLLVPGTDKMFLYRFLIPKMQIRGKEYGGEMLYTLQQIVFGWPSLVLSPFAVKAVERFRGPVNFIRIDVFIIMMTHLITYFVGYKSIPRLVCVFALEGLRNVMSKWRSVPHGMINYEMFDYVEWKTGYRSEGATQAVDGMLTKLIRNNAFAVISNAVVQWTGYKGWDVPVEEQPERFMKTIWPLMNLGVFFGELIAFIGLIWFRYPHDPKEVEADLIERRALAQKLKEEAHLNG